MKKGFTLLELIVVIVIIGILATLGYTQYNMVAERGRAAEGIVVLSTIRTAETACYLEKGTYASTLTDLGVSAPASCTSTNYFYYTIHLDTGNERAEADRCLSGGKAPNWSSPGYCNVVWFVSGRLQYNGCGGNGPGG